MSENKETPKEENKNRNPFSKKSNLPKNPFNFYWIYGIIAVALIALQTMNFGGTLKEVQQDVLFNQILKRHHVAKIVVVPNEQIAEIYIERDSLSLPQYKKDGLDKHPNGPHYKMKILDVASFKADLTEAQKDFLPTDKKIFPISEVRTSWTDQLSWLLPIVLMIVVWIIIMRRMGGGAGGGQIFNIGKSKASLFDKDT